LSSAHYRVKHFVSPPW